MSLENEVFSYLKKRGLWTQTSDSNSDIIVGPGDDAAILKRPAGNLVISTDLLTDEVDFLLEQTKPEWVGRKALGVNLSDLAAMGASPLGFTVSLAVDKQWRKPVYKNLSCINYLRRLSEGMLKLADEFNCPLVGGDTNTFSGPMVIAITIFGQIPVSKSANKAGLSWTRGAAQVGDIILVTGPLGGSIFKRQFTFTPRINEALYLRQGYEIHAAMDISDGLSLDLSRLTAASGIGAKLDLKSVPIHPDVRKYVQQNSTDKSPIQHALSDGEDFELILTVSPKTAKQMLTDTQFNSFSTKLYPIGTIIETPGLWADKRPLPISGWEH